MPLEKFLQNVFSAVIVFGLVVLIALFAFELFTHDLGGAIMALVGVLCFIFLAIGIFTGQVLRAAKILVGKTTLEFVYASPNTIQPRVLDETVIAEKRSYAEEIKKEHALPGENAPPFSAITPGLIDDILVRPFGYIMTPMYFLDNAFRIIDWNQAFTVAFDRTMEGRKGRGVIEWTYFLDNYKEVLRHGTERFSDVNKLPLIDVEDIVYTSQQYGVLNAVKRAYQIPDDNEACLGWLITLDVKFSNAQLQTQFHHDLIKQLTWDLMWSDYALSYDNVLNNTGVYPGIG